MLAGRFSSQIYGFVPIKRHVHVEVVVFLIQGTNQAALTFHRGIQFSLRKPSNQPYFTIENEIVFRGKVVGGQVKTSAALEGLMDEMNSLIGDKSR